MIEQNTAIDYAAVAIVATFSLAEINEGLRTVGLVFSIIFVLYRFWLLWAGENERKKRRGKK